MAGSAAVGASAVAVGDVENDGGAGANSRRAAALGLHEAVEEAEAVLVEGALPYSAKSIAASIASTTERREASQRAIRCVISGPLCTFVVFFFFLFLVANPFACLALRDKSFFFLN